MHKSLSKEQLAKDQERDEIMAKMMTQLDFLTKHVIEGNWKSVNVVVAVGNVVYDTISYEGGYSEEVRYIGNQMMGSYSDFPRPSEN